MALLCLYIVLPGRAQIKSLTIGSPVPNLVFKNIINYKESEIKMKELEGKIIIISFWHTHCGSCIKEMPILSKLQKQYAKQVQIILATKQNKEEVLSLFKKRKELKDLNLPTVTSDKELNKLFPYATNPHVIWIGADRKVKAITEGEYVTALNIDRLLGYHEIDLPVKADLLDFQYDQTALLNNGASVMQNVINATTLTNRIEGLSGGSGFEQMGGLSRIRIINSTALKFYMYAYQHKIKLNTLNMKTRILLHTNDTMTFDFSQEIKNPQTFCYELLYGSNLDAKNARDAALNFMQKDLDRLFHVKSSVQNIKQDCYVVSPVNTVSASASEPEYSMQEYFDSTRFKNLQVQFLVGYIQDVYPFSLPVIYEGPIENRVTLTLKKSYATIDEVQAMLLKLGYVLEKKQRMLDMLVIEQ